jgi:uncharacterized protein (DUF1015 family)
MVTLVSVEDPGLVILPTHRLIRGYERYRRSEALERASAYFDVGRLESRAALDAALAATDPAHPRLGLYDGSYVALTLRDPASLAALLPERRPEWRLLDVTVLHELFIKRVLGIDETDPNRSEAIEYLRDPQMGYDAVDQQEAQMLMLLNPTRSEQVRGCTAVGERMPQKSTDFYPKVISGLVAMPVGPAERF